MIKFCNYLFLCLAILSISARVYSGQSENLYTLQSTLISKALFLDITYTGRQFVAVGERGHIVLSEKGETWKRASVPNDVTLTGVYFHNESLGWAVGHDAVIMKTDDGGQTWRTVFSAVEEEAPLLDIWFRNSMDGIAIGAYGLYLVTSDGGETWVRTDLSVIETQEENESAGSDDLAELYDLHLNSIENSPDGTLYIVAEAGRI